MTLKQKLANKLILAYLNIVVWLYNLGLRGAGNMVEYFELEKSTKKRVFNKRR